ncbi:alpha-ketoglutarate-dependent dioxygenase AlkB family protein [Jejudonia soesokkakensis]|uniref:Alpha-ketoglutarate-dependent dioxygenase AlkB family protein n=1 Tax=Jejudonia soesokkakensis TaxID=1323432 RepID=A0ABW2MTT5_9FLAO
MNLFASERDIKPIHLPLEDGDVTYYPAFLSQEEASEYYNILFTETDWQQDDIKIFGKIYPQPRLTALYGDTTKSYSYSGITMFPKPFTPTLSAIKNKIEDLMGIQFTSVLLNLYRDGTDSNGWHSDDEKELGNQPIIASLSLGATRMFHLKHKYTTSKSYKLPLEAGSLLIMKGNTQHNWKHQIPKTKKKVDSRINLTFRIIKNDERN